MAEADACIFCAVIAGSAPAELVGVWPGVRAIVPLFPVVEGHVLVIPCTHVAHFTESPVIAASVMHRAAEYAGERGGDWNLIASKGPASTATIGHLHLHLIPRTEGDGLSLPWSNQQAVAS